MIGILLQERLDAGVRAQTRALASASGPTQTLRNATAPMGAPGPGRSGSTFARVDGTDARRTHSRGAHRATNAARSFANARPAPGATSARCCASANPGARDAHARSSNPSARWVAGGSASAVNAPAPTHGRSAAWSRIATRGSRSASIARSDASCPTFPCDTTGKTSVFPARREDAVASGSLG